MIKRYIICVAIMSLVFIAYGCGGGGEDAPVDATITINPSTVTITDGSYQDVHTQYFLITVKDANGIPLKDVDVRIAFIWASPDGKFQTLFYNIDCVGGTNETPLAQLYDGNTAKNSPFTATTDENGSYMLRFDFVSGGQDLDCDTNIDVDTNNDPVVFEWSADIEVTSGSVFGSSSFEVKAPS